MKTTSLIACTAAVAVFGTAAGIATAGSTGGTGDHHDDNVTICHATGASTFQRLTLSPNTVLKRHAKVHPDDIIPPFDYDHHDDAAASDHHGSMFAGQNWDATGQMTWSNACVVPPAPVPAIPLGPSTPITPPPVPPDSPPFIPLIPAATAQSTGVVTTVNYCHLNGDAYVPASGAPGAVLDHIRSDQGDIVPPFMWQSGTSVYAFPGLNWTVGGEETWAAGCTGARTVADAVAGEAIVVTLNALLEVNCALHVDSLAGLRGSDAFLSSTAAAADAPAYFGNCFVDAEAQRWQEINLRALAQSPSFLSIGA